MKQRGFTLLEALVATMIMALAVTALLSNLSTSLRSASKLTDNDRAALAARARMDELLLDSRLPHNSEIQGRLDPALTGWPEAGWRATVRVFEAPPGAGPGTNVLERIDLQVWWRTPSGQRTYALDGYRRGVMRPEDVGRIQ